MRRARSFALVLFGAACALAGACSTSQAPLGNGDDIISDVDGADAPPPQGDDAAEDYDAAVFAPVDSAYPPPPDGYTPFDFCTQCGCPSDTYCFGGGTGYSSFNGQCHADAGALEDAAQLAIGCYPFPSACANEPSCECLIGAISQYMPCYPVCSITTNIVYCPNP
jgi:hypothetical protein